MSDNNSLNDSSVVEITGRIMVISIIVLFLVVVFVFFLHLYAKWFWHRRDHEAIHGASNNRRRGQLTPADILRRGLDASVLKSIPVVQFDPKDYKDGLECAVCLSELSEGEKARILPKCNHGFHADCIDMWFHSHSTCPICRNSIPATTEVSPECSLDSPAAETEENPPENGDNSSRNFPTNVLFWGDETQVSSLAGSNMVEEGPSNSVSETTTTQSSTSSSSSSGAERALVIDIQRQIMDQEDGKHRIPSMKGALVIDIPSHNEDQEDQRSPISSRIRSLKRLLSRDRRFNPFSPTSIISIDVEQGVRSQT